SGGTTPRPGAAGRSGSRSTRGCSGSGGTPGSRAPGSSGRRRAAHPAPRCCRGAARAFSSPDLFRQRGVDVVGGPLRIGEPGLVETPRGGPDVRIAEDVLDPPLGVAYEKEVEAREPLLALQSLDDPERRVLLDRQVLAECGVVVRPQ